MKITFKAFGNAVIDKADILPTEMGQIATAITTCLVNGIETDMRLSTPQFGELCRLLEVEAQYNNRGQADIDIIHDTTEVRIHTFNYAILAANACKD
jgi:hypothetical protein